MTETVPPDWKAMDDFAAGIDGNRLPPTGALAGTSLTVRQADGEVLRLGFRTGSEAGEDGSTAPLWYEAVEVRPGLHYLTLTEPTRPLLARVLVVNRNTGRTLTVTSVIADRPTPGRR